MAHQKILILDFGSQVTQLIARRVREAKVFAKCIPTTFQGPGFHPQLRRQRHHPVRRPEFCDRGDTPARRTSCSSWAFPVLGICYGMQTMAQQLGGRS